MSGEDEGIITELKITNRLLVQLLIKDAENQKTAIGLLSKAGFKPVDIANLMNIKDNIVRASISTQKRNEAPRQKLAKKGVES